MHWTSRTVLMHHGGSNRRAAPHTSSRTEKENSQSTKPSPPSTRQSTNESSMTLRPLQYRNVTVQATANERKVVQATAVDNTMRTCLHPPLHLDSPAVSSSITTQRLLVSKTTLESAKPNSPAPIIATACFSTAVHASIT